MYYYQLQKPIAGTSWTQVYPLHLPVVVGNPVSTTLSLSATSSATSITVANGAGIRNNLYLQLGGGEIVLVTAGCPVSGASTQPCATGQVTLTVARGQLNTSPASHNSGSTVKSYSGAYNSGTVVHDTDHDAFIIFDYDQGNNSQAMAVYCDTSQNPTPGTLTSAQKSVGCANPDDWTAITGSVKGGDTAASTGFIPAGYNYPNLAYDSIHHEAIHFAGLYGCCTQKNDTWIYNPATKVWANQKPANPPANSSANNEGGRVAFAWNSNDGKYYYHLTANTPNAGNPPASAPQDWVYDPAANTWTHLSTGLGPQLAETMTYDSGANALIVWAANVSSNGKYNATGIAEIWMGRFGSAVAPAITSTSPLTPGIQNSSYSYSFSATGTAPITWSVTSGSPPAGLSLNSSGVLSGTPTATGTSTFSVQATNSAGTAGPQSFSLTVAASGTAPAITSSSPLAQGTQNAAYSFTFSATGTTPITWNLASGTLPAGLSLSSSGALTGTPTGTGTSTFMIQASNSAGTAGPQSFTLTVAASGGGGGGSLSVPLTVQEALYPGSVSGINRTNEPFCQGVPLADSAGINSTATLGLTGANAGQFRMLGTWPSGNYKWIEVCGIVPTLSAGGTTSVTLTNSGSGNFGGANLATDNGATIAVSTGAAQFTVRKANFNGVDQVVIGSTTVVASGSSPGFVLTGPSPTAAYPNNVTCGSGTCTTVYSSANDPNSTCLIEKNGPVEAVLKCTFDHVDSSGHVYMHGNARMYFYSGKTSIKVTSSLRNADYGTSNTFATAYKGHQGYELRIAPNISGTLNYTIANDTGSPTTGTVSGTDSVYIYQGESQLMKYYNYCGSGCVPFTTDTGYKIVKNTTTLLSGGDTQYPQGWADISNAAGVGVEIGVYLFSAYWPKSLEFNGGGTDVRIGIWARENSQPYYQEWPQYSTHDLYVNFHTSAPASPANEFLKFQHYLVARAAFSYYNTSAVFPYPLIDPATEDGYYQSVGAAANPATISSSRVCCIQDLGTSDPNWPMLIYRYYYWHDGGGDNQTEFRWSFLMNFLTRGMTGRYMRASHFYRFLADSAWPRSDGFNWRDRPHLTASNPELDGFGFPTAASANSSLATGHANWLDQEHGHWYGLPDYYFLSGDESIKDALLDGPKDYFLNLDTYQAGQYQGTSGWVNTSGTAVTYAGTGDTFIPEMALSPIFIGNTLYTIASITDSNHLTLTSSAGTQSFVSYSSFGGLWNTRSVGVELKGASRLSTFLSAVGDSDAPAVLTQGVNDYLSQVNSQLCVSGYPSGCSFGPTQPAGTWTTEGISRTRGLHYGGTQSYLNPWCGNNSAQVRGAAPFFVGNLVEGILLLRQTMGPSWSEYLNSLDLAYGLSRWSLSETYVDDGSGRWDINGFRYYIALDLPGSCAGMGGVQDSHTQPQPQQTIWFDFLPKYLVDGDTSWANKFNIAIQRDMAALGMTTSDFGSYPISQLISVATSSPGNTLNPVSISSFTNNGGGSYTLSWTVPAGAQSYRIKWGTKQIVDWIGFDPINNVFTGDPVNTMPWFAATNVPNLPAPAAGGTTQSLTINTGVTNLTAANFSVKAYTAAGGSGSPTSCDLNRDGVVNIADVQLAINQSLGILPCTSADLDADGVCNITDVQREINASLGGPCLLGAGSSSSNVLRGRRRRP